MSQAINTSPARQASNALLEAANPDALQRNAFRVLGLPVEATERDASRQAEKLQMLRKYGATSAKTGGMLPLNPAPDDEALRAAEQRFRDPELHLIDEFFWFWPEVPGDSAGDSAIQALSRGDRTAAEEKWKARSEASPPSVVASHNLGVLTLAEALDFETAPSATLSAENSARRDAAWKRAFTIWPALAADNRLWERLAERIRQVNDPRLPTGTEGRIRLDLPLALLSIVARLAVEASQRGEKEDVKRLHNMARASGLPEDEYSEALRRCAQPIRARIAIQTQTASANSTERPTEGVAIARALIESTREALAAIDAALPEGHAIRVGAHDSVAQSCLGAIIDYGNKTDDMAPCIELCPAVLAIASSEAARKRIEKNSKIFQSNLAYNVCFFCKRSPATEAASWKVTMKGNFQTQHYGNMVRTTWNERKVRVPRCDACKKAHGQKENRTVGFTFAGIGLAIVAIILLFPDGMCGLWSLIGRASGGDFLPFLCAALLVVGWALAGGLGAHWAGQATYMKDILPHSNYTQVSQIAEIKADGWIISA